MAAQHAKRAPDVWLIRLFEKLINFAELLLSSFKSFFFHIFMSHLFWCGCFCFASLNQVHYYLFNRTPLIGLAAKQKHQTYIERAHTHCTHVPGVLETHVWQDANRRGAMKSGWIHASGGWGWGVLGVVKKGSGVWLFSGPPSLRASNSWNQTSTCINTLLCAWMHAPMHAPTSHLHGTRWCWECDVRLDSSARRVLQLSPHQSYSASPAVQETTPEEKDGE